MIKVTFPDGSIRDYRKGVTLLDIAESISSRLAGVVFAAEVDGELKDLNYRPDSDMTLRLLKFDEQGGREAFRHSASHVLAQAVKRLYPDVRLAIGPAIENGFYYDFDREKPFTPDELENIEEEMNRIVGEDLLIERFEMSREKAIEYMRDMDEPYKVELIEDLGKDEKISFYRQGEFVDLCAGPHVVSTGRIKAFKLLQVAGAYWRGDEKNKMLQRIYGTAFPRQKELNEYLKQLEEAKNRDHNKLGRELGLFMTSEPVGQGLPLFTPRGAKVLRILRRFVEDEEEKRGYMATMTPFLAKSDLYRISGHWDHYHDGMFIIGEEKDEEVMALRPMTCPFQFMIYKAQLHSYRDLPVRYSETSTLFRNETSGEMHGLIRVRQFTLSEGHIICTPEQLENEFMGAMNLINYIMETLGISDDIWYRFSKWDPQNREKYIDNPEAWEYSQKKMKNILDKMKLDYVEADGEAAFYGPKLDLQFRNVHGKEDTIITIQVDFALPEKFDMVYVDNNNEKKRPIIIHRSSIGCYERTLAMLIEKFAGAFPTWLAPVQARIITVAEKHNEYAADVEKLLKGKGIRVETDLRNEKIGYKIREARLEKIPYMLVVGDREQEARSVAVRSRKQGDMGAVPIDEFLDSIMEEIETRAL